VTRPTWAEVDPQAIADNVRALRALVAPAAVCAVVKAGGYGHGAVTAARGALAGGAQWLAVALVEEAAELRAAGIQAPILVLSEPRQHEMAEAVGLDLRVAVYTPAGIDAASRAALDAGVTLAVHIKIDTGMHRVGADPFDVVMLADRIMDVGGLELEGVMTHFAVADEPDNAFTAEQFARFEAARHALATGGHRPVLAHAANSAGALAHAATRLDLVRCGISIYGLAPSPQLAGAIAVRPALRLRSEVTHVQRIRAGEKVSYGQRWQASRATTLVTVPIGYADGVRRSAGFDGVEVLINGERCPIVGTVTMDQLLVDCGAMSVFVGDEVVLIGTQGDEQITADEIAERIGTIGYEVVCAIGERVPRRLRENEA
jgi:alanine racemase